MYDVVLPVTACLRAGTRVDVAWAVEVTGFAGRDRGEALALTPGGGRIGGVLGGAANDQLADAAARGGRGRLVSLTVSDLEAQVAGLARGGSARCLVVPGDALPTALWQHLADREAVCLVSQLDGDQVLDTSVFTADDVSDAGEEAARLFARGVSDAAVTETSVVTVLCPVPKLVIVGGGPIAQALSDAARLLGWNIAVGTDPATATGLIAGLAPLDKVVVMAHDVEVAGPALEAALATDVGYIAGLGARHMQQLRADWLAMRGATGADRIHGPAGLDIGAGAPAEIAVSVLAEALAVRAGASGGFLSGPTGQTGPTGQAGPTGQTGPPRQANP